MKVKNIFQPYFYSHTGPASVLWAAQCYHSLICQILPDLYSFSCWSRERTKKATCSNHWAPCCSRLSACSRAQYLLLHCISLCENVPFCMIAIISHATFLAIYCCFFIGHIVKSMLCYDDYWLYITLIFKSISIQLNFYFWQPKLLSYHI